MKILLIGFGFVGKATYLLNNKDITVYVFDINPELCIPNNINFNDVINIVDLIFISLPTPTNIDGSCYTNIIDETINKIKLINNEKLIIIRSTVPVGYCDSKNIFFMPEFLTEKNWKDDFINNKYWLFGIYENCPLEIENSYKKLIFELFLLAYNNQKIKYNNIIFGKNKEIELSKLIRNTFLSTKVSYFNEIYDLCCSLHINYNQLIDYVKLDDRIGLTHMACPGHDGLRGFGGTCFPKDTICLYNQLNSNNINSYILQAVLDRNENHDRIIRDWLKDIDRTNVAKSNYKIILVSGGAGFLGRHLCKKLLEDINNRIICVDNLSSGSLYNIEEFKDNNNFKFINFDIKNKLFLPRIDEIYHLACLASPEKYKKFSIETLITCFEGTKNMLDLAKKHNAKILFSSTSEVYGDPLIHPQPEEYYGNVNTMGERSCYDEGKRVAETLMYEYRKKYNIDTKVIRIFNTYGPYMSLNDGRVITNFIKQIKNNENIYIYGDGTKTRSFCYVDDLIDGIYKMMNSTESGPINLGNPNCEFTLNELFCKFEKILNIKLEIQYVQETENDPKVRKPIIDKAVEKLNFNPKIELEEGLKNTINFYMKFNK